MKKLLTLGLMLFVAYTTFAQYPVTGVITGVHDGDSYLFKPDSAFNDTTRYIRVRLLGCDAPEVLSPYSIEEPLGRFVGDKMRSTYKGERVLFLAYGLDKYGRTLGTMYAGDRDLSYELLINGWATYLKPKKMDNAQRIRYRKARDFAKKHKLGIWGLTTLTKKKKYKN